MDTRSLTRSPSGDPLPLPLLARLRAALVTREPRTLVHVCGVSEHALLRAAAGARVMRASRIAIAAGLEALEREAAR